MDNVLGILGTLALALGVLLAIGAFLGCVRLSRSSGFTTRFVN
jgi:hypothetical protein